MGGCPQHGPGPVPARQLDRLQDITRAEVTSAEQLNDNEKAELAAALEKMSGRRIKADFRLNPALIAGAVVRIGSTIYDGTVRTQLERLRGRLDSI